MILNLTPGFEPFGPNQVKYESFVFSGGEPHIKIHDSGYVAARISHRINSLNDLGLLCVAVDALRRNGVKYIDAFIPYFPGARQDRVMVPGEPLTVKVYADIINGLKLDGISIFDPHSEVTPALLDRCTVFNNHLFINKICDYLDAFILLISPDGGALKKIYGVAESLGGRHVIECSKVRDTKTGRLSGFKVYADDLQGRDCLIVDDICDGGGTFIGLAEELRKKNAGKLYLAVSHGIFSKGMTELNNAFDQIYTTDSISGSEGMLKANQYKFSDGLLY